MLCQIINSLLLLPVAVARPLLSHLLDLLPPLDRLNRLLPAASPLEDQELQWPLHGEQAAIQHVQTVNRTHFIHKVYLQNNSDTRNY